MCVGDGAGAASAFSQEGRGFVCLTVGRRFLDPWIEEQSTSQRFSQPVPTESHHVHVLIQANLPLLLRLLTGVTHSKGKGLRSVESHRSVFCINSLIISVIFQTFDLCPQHQCESITTTNLHQRLCDVAYTLTPNMAKLPWTTAAHWKFRFCVMSPPTIGP